MVWSLIGEDTFIMNRCPANVDSLIVLKRIIAVLKPNTQLSRVLESILPGNSLAPECRTATTVKQRNIISPGTKLRGAITRNSWSIATSTSSRTSGKNIIIYNYVYIHIQTKEQNKTRSYRPSCKVKVFLKVLDVDSLK